MKKEPALQLQATAAFSQFIAKAAASNNAHPSKKRRFEGEVDSDEDDHEGSNSGEELDVEIMGSTTRRLGSGLSNGHGL